ncbi:hypothetical protein D1872_272990 [compost metagenome]
MHIVDAAGSRRGSHGSKQGRLRNAEANLFPLHTALRRIDSHGMDRRVSFAFRIEVQGQQQDEQDHHGAEYAPTLPFVLGKQTIHVWKRCRQHPHRKYFNHVGQR